LTFPQAQAFRQLFNTIAFAVKDAFSDKSQGARN
jgi:hypothetical protein